MHLIFLGILNSRSRFNKGFVQMPRFVNTFCVEPKKKIVAELCPIARKNIVPPPFLSFLDFNDLSRSIHSDKLILLSILFFYLNNISSIFTDYNFYIYIYYHINIHMIAKKKYIFFKIIKWLFFIFIYKNVTRRKNHLHAQRSINYIKN